MRDGKIRQRDADASRMQPSNAVHVARGGILYQPLIRLVRIGVEA